MILLRIHVHQSNILTFYIWFRFDTHKLILAAASEFFAALFEPNFADSNNKEYIVKDLDGPSLKKIVDCCYTGVITFSDQSAYDIIKVANYLRLSHIEQKCVEYFTKILNCENCVSQYITADSLSLSIWKTKTFELICQKFKQISTQEWRRLNSTQFLNVLKSNTIEAPEEMVFTKLKEWVESDDSERSKYVPELMKYIQLNRIDGNVSLTS